MASVVLIGALVLYGLASILLFAFGANLMRFSWLSMRHRTRDLPDGGTPGEGASRELWPMVTVQLPLFNELFVARRVIEAAARLDYPEGRLEIQVLDDSNDGSSVVVAEAVEQAKADGVDITHVRRVNREGYKAGALAAGLQTARGDLVAVFDADFVPPADFLRRTVHHFDEAEVGFVQGRWGHLNGDDSWLTRIQVPAIDGHFLVEQQARGIGGHWFNFNGTAGVWRVDAISDAGGWQCDTLTEDLDLSYRAHLRGWRGVYRPDVVVPAELPADVTAFRRQQHRWARGSLECARKLLSPIWASPASVMTKLQASLHLLAYGVHLLLLLMVVSYPAVVLANPTNGETPWWYWATLLPNVMSAAPVVFLVSGQLAQSRRIRPTTVAATVIYGSGLMVNTARAAAEIFFKPNPVFERTAKLGRNDPTTKQVAATLDPAPSLDRIVVAEFGLAIYTAATAAFAADRGSWGIAVYATLFSLGLTAVGISTASTAVRHRRTRRQHGVGNRPAPALTGGS